MTQTEIPIIQSTTTNTPRIYVACLASYNSGVLHGRWINADQSAEAIHAEIKAMLAESDEEIAEEWAIHDQENFHDIAISEFEPIENIAKHAEMIAEHGSAWAAYCQCFDADECDDETFRDRYRGKWTSEEAFAEDLVRDTQSIPDHLENYIDWEKFARDLFMGDFVSVERDRSVYVFATY